MDQIVSNVFTTSGILSFFFLFQILSRKLSLNNYICEILEQREGYRIFVNESRMRVTLKSNWKIFPGMLAALNLSS